jgi:uncharacterized membrane protein YuzA (DUF378 family)
VDPTPAPDAQAPSPKDESKARKKELKKLLENSRPLDSWERYRALCDAMDEAYDLLDISNREARFALILMGALNAAMLVVSTRTDLLQSMFGQFPVVVGTVLGLYVITAVYFFLQAIEALRPGRFKPRLDNWDRDADDYPQGVRYFEDVVQRDVRQHWQAWTDVQTGQLNAEIAIQFHSLCLKNAAKRLALRRLFAGLRIMTLLVAGFLTLLVFATMRG